jgi:integrase
MRPRKKDRHLPPCVYQRRSSYWYVKKGKWTKLGDDLHSALVEYARIMAVPTDGVGAMLDKAWPHITEGLSDSTKGQYAYCVRLLKEVFAEFRPDQVTHGTIVQMMDMFSDRRTIANRMLTVLRLAYQWAMDREIVHQNPTLSVKRYHQRPRDRLVTQEEYQRIYAAAAPWLQVIMDLCYLTGQRIGDVLKIEYGHLLDDGIFIEQQKTGKKLIVAWTPELRAVVDRAKEMNYRVKSLRYLLSGRAGTMRRHSNVWRHFKEAARKAGLEDVTLHDLRAMAGTEAERQGIDPTALLGHTDRRTTKIYLRDRSAKVVTGPTKSNRKAG